MGDFSVYVYCLILFYFYKLLSEINLDDDHTVLHAGVDENDLVNVFRLGRLAENEGPRPLMVQFASYSIKNLVMESLYKLKHAEQKFKNVIIAHDMTIK